MFHCPVWVFGGGGGGGYIAHFIVDMIGLAGGLNHWKVSVTSLQSVKTPLVPLLGAYLVLSAPWCNPILWEITMALWILFSGGEQWDFGLLGSDLLV